MKTILGIGLLAGLSILIACSSDDAPSTPTAPETGNDAGSVLDAGSSADTGPTTNEPGAACTTPHRTFDVANTDYFRVFSSVDDALTHLENALPNNPTPFLPAGNDFEKRGAEITTKVFEAYQKLYPEATKGMTAVPLVVIGDSDQINGNAFGIDVDKAIGAGLIKTPQVLADCRALLATGATPPYAGTIDPHHATCWRNYRDLKLGKALETCAASWPQ